jgi:hypothetical protein
MDDSQVNEQSDNPLEKIKPSDCSNPERRRLLKVIKQPSKTEIYTGEDPVIIRQLLELSEKLGRQPITRRNLLQLSAIGTSLILINTIIAKTDEASCSFDPIVSCKGKIEPTQTVANFSASVLRKEDMLALRFDFYNLQLNGTNLERLNSTSDSFIVVNFAHGNDYSPQNIGEEAYLETAETLNNDTEDPSNDPNPLGGSETPDQPGYVGARLAGGSRLVFKVPKPPNGPSSIPFTMDELLSWEKYELSVAPTALPADDRIQGQEPVEPLYKETAIEVPWRLIISPNYHGGWAHALNPVTRNKRTELWHTRLGVRIQDTANPGQWTVDEQQEYYRTLRAIWAQGFELSTTPDANGLSPFRMSLTNNDRWQLVRLTSDYDILIPAAVPLYYNPLPIQVERFMLSTLGGWMNTRGEWPDAPAFADLDIIEWRHLATMARDHYVRIVYSGFLFPTGHAATLVKVTERKFQAVPPGEILTGQPAAYLRQRFYIVVRQPVKTYPAHTSQPYGGREWPFESVCITTLITPSLDNPSLHGDAYDLDGQGQKAFWPRVNDQDFQFHLVAVDSDGQRTEFTCPLAFISSTLQQSEDISSFIEPAIDSYNSGSANQSRRERKLQGQKVAFAPSTKKDGLTDGKPGDTSAEVKVIVLGATLPSPGSASLPDDQPRFFPTWQEAEVRLPSAEQACGSALPGPVVIQIHPDFRDNGFNESTNPGYIWAKLKNQVALSFDGAGDKSGGVVTPNIKIGGLSRTIGVVGGTVNSTPTQFDPTNFFNGAKILGGILLADIIKAANFGDGRKTPQLTNVIIYPDGDNSLPPQAMETRLDWKPDLEPDPLKIFEPSGSTSMEVKGTFITPLDPPGEPTYNIVGDLRSFWVNILGEDFLFLRLHFNKVIFITETGKKPNVDVDIDQVEFAGILEFVNALKNFMKTSGTGLNIDITPTQISAGFTLPIPTVAVGVITIQNISLGVKLIIPFTGNPARVRFNFCEREQPFLLTIYAFGGGGFFAIEVGLDGVERLEAALEFGASMALNIGVATGEVHVMGGIYFEMEKVGQPDESASLTAYIRMGGSLEVLGIITVSVEFYLGMKYQITANELWGQAKLTVKVKVLFFSASVELSVERRLAGGGDGSSSSSTSTSVEAMSTGWLIGTPVKPVNQIASTGGGNFEDLMTLDDWTEYTGAFAPLA